MKLIGGLLVIFMFGCASSTYRMETADNKVTFYKSDNAEMLTSEKYMDSDKDGKIDMIRSLYKKQDASFWLMAYYKIGMFKLVLDRVGGRTPGDIRYMRYRNIPLYRNVYAYKIPAYHLTFDMEKDGIWDFAVIDIDGDSLMEHMVCRVNCDSLMAYYRALNE